jgi:glycosyltransferase involved in cell wall biosynthesis
MEQPTVTRILFIADPNSLHNQKWIRFFSNQPARYEVYLLCETPEEPSEVCQLWLSQESIKFLGCLAPFSIKSPRRNVREHRRFIDITQRYLIDCVHVLFATPYALWLRKYRGKSVISTRGSDVLQVLPSLLNQKGVKRIYCAYLFRLFKKSFAKAHSITSTSNQQVDAVHRLFDCPSICIRTGVDVRSIETAEALYPVQVDGRFKLFSPRFVAPIYDTLFQIAGLSQLDSPELLKIHFLCIRGKNCPADYWRLVELRLSALEVKGLTWNALDYLGQVQMFQAYKAADAVLMTPVSDGTPNSALECMVAGTPLILSDLPYDPELFDDTCLKLRNRSPEGLAEQIRYVMNGNYPSEFLLTAKDRVVTFGNREREMKRLEALIYGQHPLSNHD